MSALRVSATDIDAYRRFLSPPEGMEIELDELLRQLRRQEPPSEAMMAGSAFHKLLENAAPVVGELSEAEVDGFRFFFDFDGALDLPKIREMKATRDYDIDGCTITVVGKVDGVHGHRIEDHKLTSRYDAERFLNSYQWRIYLDIFEANEFRWNIFEGREAQSKRYVISHFHQLRTYIYPEMHADVQKVLGAFLAFAREFLPERFLARGLEQLNQAGV